MKVEIYIYIVRNQLTFSGPAQGREGQMHLINISVNELFFHFSTQEKLANIKPSILLLIPENLRPTILRAYHNLPLASYQAM